MRAGKAYQIATDQRRQAQKTAEQKIIDKETKRREASNSLFAANVEVFDTQILQMAESGVMTHTKAFDVDATTDELVNRLVVHYETLGYKTSIKQGRDKIIGGVGGAPHVVDIITLTIDWSDQ